MPDQPKLNLLVLRSVDPERAIQFYQTLGLTFVSEKHGNSPEHFAASIDGLILEIYPAQSESSTSAPIRLGFHVASVDHAVQRLTEAGATCLKPPHNSNWGRRAVVKDLDGNSVELSE